MEVTLLGPQRRVTAARAAVAELMPDGPIATVNAGWQERESDSAELGDVLGGRMVNLELYRRWQQLTAADEDYAAAERRLTALLAEIQDMYAIRLDHQMAALEAVGRRGEVPAVQSSAALDALGMVQQLDRWHLDVVAETRAEFFAAVRPGERDIVAQHRAEIEAQVAGCAGMVFAGGHVGVLLHLLHLFDVSRLIRKPLIAWSAGAMALSDRVVLFHDHAPQEVRHAQVYADGIGVYSGVLPFPHARWRLRLDDVEHLGQLARRFEPHRCVLLADGARLDLRDGEPLPIGARWLSRTGGVTTTEEAA